MLLIMLPKRTVILKDTISLNADQMYLSIFAQRSGPSQHYRVIPLIKYQQSMREGFSYKVLFFERRAPLSESIFRIYEEL